MKKIGLIKALQITEGDKEKMDEIKEIVSYGAKWDIDERYGYLWLKDAEGTVHEVEVKNASELHLLMHLLQTEDPLYYHVVEKYISTSMEHIGKE